jgi:type IV conjugative transfer system protein TraL
MSSREHVILNHVDSPLKILFWTKGEISLFLGPFFIGMFLDEFIFGVFVSILNAWVVSQYKKRFGRGQLQAVLYWYLPQIKSLSAIPPSYVREYLG